MMNWKFQQLYVPNPRSLELADWAAPFGRARREPVIKEVIRSRVQSTRYPGKSGSPTRHVFGTDFADETELKGRWMTRNLPGATTAKDMADTWIGFVKDEATCMVSWGSYASWQVFIQELELAHEDQDNIAWKMKLLVDGRDAFVNTAVAIPTPDLIDNTKAILARIVRLADAQKQPADLQDGLSFFDNINLLLGEINKYPALLADAVDQIDSLETATISTLNQLDLTLVDLQTTVITARENLATFELDEVNFAQKATRDMQWSTWQSAFDTESSVLLDLVSFLRTRTNVAGRGGASKTLLAGIGDNWESMAIRATGAADLAGVIRSMNGIKYGQRPIPGQIYLTP